MRRRRDPELLPADVVVFDGRPYRTSAAWSAAFAEFLAARAAWSEKHDGALAPYQVTGECPFDWSRFRRSEVLR